MHKTDDSVIGVIAGNGIFPLLFARSARARGLRVVAVGIRGETDPTLENEVDEFVWVKFGQLRKTIKSFQRFGVIKAAMAGGIRKTRLFEVARLDFMATKVLAKCAIWRDDGMLRVIAKEYERNGIHIVNSLLYMPDALAPEGILTSKQPSSEEIQDLTYGLRIAREVGKLDIGQTVIVRNGAVVALEAIEGTDACIRRAGTLMGGRSGVMVKIAKPYQDMRFDVPTVGKQTVCNLVNAGITVLGIEAKRTLMLDPQEIINIANAKGLCVVGLR